MRPKQLKELAEEVIDLYPDAGNLTIAKVLVEEYPALFDSVEIARTIVRRVRGNAGDKRRHTATRPRPNGDPGKAMPRSLARTRDPFEVSEAGTWLVISDLHVPYHIERALDVALSEEFDHILINGDFIDFHRLSRFVPDKEAASVESEIEAGIAMLEYLRSRCEGRIVYKMGNHDERLEDYFARKCPEIVKVKGLGGRGYA